MRVYIFCLGMVMLGFQNCAKVKVGAGTANSSSTAAGVTSSATSGGVCTNVAAITRPTKLVFVVDISGSNAAATSADGMYLCHAGAETCLPASDPQKTFRAGTVSAFLNTYGAKSNFEWSLITFADAAHSLVAGSFGGAAAMRQALATFVNQTDDGGTAYLTALQAAVTTIASDPDLHAASAPQYLVVFMSDGFPTDDYGNAWSPAATYGQVAISSLLALAPGRVSVSSVYYGYGNSAQALSTLKDMSTWGSGNFANVTNSSGVFAIDDIIPGTACGG